MYTFVSHSPKEGFMPGFITAVVSCHVDWNRPTVWPVPSLLSAAIICITRCWVLYTCGLGSEQNRWIKALGSLWQHKVWCEEPNVWCCMILHYAAWCCMMLHDAAWCCLVYPGGQLLTLLLLRDEVLGSHFQLKLAQLVFSAHCPAKAKVILNSIYLPDTVCHIRVRKHNEVEGKCLMILNIFSKWNINGVGCISIHDDLNHLAVCSGCLSCFFSL